MVHTNYTVPKYGEAGEFIEYKLLETKAREWENRAQFLQRQIESMFDSIKTNGFLTLSSGDETLRLIQDPADAQPVGE